MTSAYPHDDARDDVTPDVAGGGAPSAGASASPFGSSAAAGAASAGVPGDAAGVGGEATASAAETGATGDDTPRDTAADTAVVDVEALVAERDQFKDDALRAAAELVNFRRQVAIRREEDIDRATAKLAEALLPVLDAFEAAFLQHPAEIEPLFNLLLGELRKHGLEAMHLDGQPFDPNLAEAVLHEPGDADEPVVAEVLRSGYTWKGKVLRAAMVKVTG